MLQEEAATLLSPAGNEPHGPFQHTSAGDFGGTQMQFILQISCPCANGHSVPNLTILFGVTCHMLLAQQPGFLVT